MTLFERSAKELQAEIKAGNLSIADLTKEAYERIAKLDGDVQAFLASNEEKQLHKLLKWIKYHLKSVDHYSVYQSV